MGILKGDQSPFIPFFFLFFFFFFCFLKKKAEKKTKAILDKWN